MPLDCVEYFDLSQKINLPKLPAPQKKPVMLRVAMHPENHQLHNVSKVFGPAAATALLSPHLVPGAVFDAGHKERGSHSRSER